MRRLRPLLIFALGAWAGLTAAAWLLRWAMPSQGDEDSNEVALVAIFDGVELKSRARAFRGGSMFTWFGGIAVDLREAELAPGARLSARTLFGGIAIRIPPGWRVESNAKALAGGIDVQTPAQDDPDAPVLTLDGAALFGGIAVGAKEDDAGPASGDDGD